MIVSILKVIGYVLQLLRKFSKTT